MLLCDRFDGSEGIDINKTGVSKECIIWHYWYLKNIGYNFEQHICNGCDLILMMTCELKNIEILNVKGLDYSCVLWNVTRNDANNILHNSKLADKGILWIRLMVQIKHPLK